LGLHSLIMRKCCFIFITLSLVSCYDLISTYDRYSPYYLEPGRLQFSVPNPMNFGTVNLGQPVTDTITLSNPGDRPVTLTEISLVGSGFTLPSTVSLPLILQGGASIELDVEMVTSSATTQTATLRAKSDKTTENLALTGVISAGAVNPDIRILQGKNGGEVIYIDGEEFDFGGDLSSELTAWHVPFYIENAGTGSATGVSVSVNGTDFQIHGEFSGDTIPNGTKSSEFRLQFPSGGALGVKNAQVTVAFDGPGTMTLNLKGESAPSTPILIFVDRNSTQTFIRENAGHSAPLPAIFRDFKLINSGAGSILINNPVSSDPANFILQNPLVDVTLNAGEKYDTFGLMKSGTAPSVSYTLTINPGGNIFYFSVP